MKQVQYRKSNSTNME